jgi:hypothetical protein
MPRQDGSVDTAKNEKSNLREVCGQQKLEIVVKLPDLSRFLTSKNGFSRNSISRAVLNQKDF